MATHSIVLAWRIPGTAEPGGWRLLSMGSHRVGCDLAAAATDGETEVLWDRKFDFHKKNEVVSVQADLGSTEAQRAMPNVYLWRIHFDIWQNYYNYVKFKSTHLKNELGT